MLSDIFEKIEIFVRMSLYLSPLNTGFLFFSLALQLRIFSEDEVVMCIGW